MSKSLSPPDNYQHFGWYIQGSPNKFGVVLDDPDSLKEALDSEFGELYFYTSHQISYEDGIIKQTRSSPNWDGGMVTYAT